MNELKLAKEEAVKLLHPNGNVVGVGIGKKVRGGKETQEDCVRVYVVWKIVPDNLRCKSRVPASFLGVPTDVIPVGRFGRTGDHSKVAVSATPQPGTPIRVKTNAPNVNEGVRGTMGAVVTDGNNEYILSCNHLLARNDRVPINAPVVSAEFVGEEEEIAKRRYFVMLERHRGNPVDCAVALLTKKVPATFPDGFKLSPEGPDDPKRDIKVTKFGAITRRTEGIIVDTDADLYIDYSFGTFLFQNQVIIAGGDDHNFAAAGDSGSIVVDQSTSRASAMIFAASGSFAVACPLKTVLQKLAEEAKISKLEVVV